MKKSNTHRLFPLLLLLLAVSCKKDCPAPGQLAETPNASFEGIPAQGTNPDDFNLNSWKNCGFPGQTPPEIHPGEGEGFFGVTTLPYDGETYLGLVVRDNDTWEAVGSMLGTPLVANQQYKFSIAACRSDVYQLLGNQVSSFRSAVRLRIWGGSDFCADEELLAQSETVTNTEWELLNFTIKPSKQLQYVKLEAFYKEGSLFPYNGNILLDKASAFEPI